MTWCSTTPIPTTIRFVAEAGDLFDGDFVTPQFMPFEADAGNPCRQRFIDTMAELGRDLSELAMVGWINADAAYTAILSAGPVFDRKSAIDALNSQTAYDAGGLIVPIDWSRQHVTPVEGDATNDYALECFAPVRMSGGALETVADPATPWFCGGQHDPRLGRAQPNSLRRLILTAADCAPCRQHR
ncbi:MAG: hypothetical protein Ct9H300mP12_03780 [Acidimicrobiales bacterium]|nr:MAG: hypothetical protein Ct9H300mP12_03780 [Acidimicrobiales bacterium]